MPVQLFNEAERDQRDRFPQGIAYEDLIIFFTLSESDRHSIPRYSAAHNRLGYALQLCALRFMGFVPDDLSSAPPEAVAFVAQQLDVEPTVLKAYGKRAHTRQDHLQAVQAHLGYRQVGKGELVTLASWLLDRALEHDKPTLLYELACEKLRSEQLIRPGVTRLERLVAEARHEAQTATFRRLAPILTAECTAFLDTLLQLDPDRGMTPLAWLRRAAVANSPRAILGDLDKLDFLRQAGVASWKLDDLNPNRIQLLAQLARRASGQALQRAPAERRYPILVAFLYQSLIGVTDEAIEMFDRCLADTNARAEQDLSTFRATVAKATNEKAQLFRALSQAILDPTIDDAELRATIYQRVSRADLQRALEDSERIVRPLDDNYFDFLKARYTYLRQFTPMFLNTFTFYANPLPNALLEAVETLRDLNTSHRRLVSQEAPTDFIPLKWRPYVIDAEGEINRHYYELCTLWELRGALRGGNVWVQPSRRYANPESYLIPKEQWPALRAEVCQQVRAPLHGEQRLEERGKELVDLLPRVDRIVAPKGKGKGDVRMENGALIVPSFEADNLPDSAKRLQTLITERLPLIDLPDLLVEVDQWTGFSQHLRHLGGREPRRRDFLPVQYASLLAQGANFGLARMAQMADIPVDRLAWCTTWYLHDEALKGATNALVNFHHHLPLSQRWGGGTLSSSDGQRIPVAGKIRKATALPRYFLYQGLTYYSWTSDQFSQYGTKVVPATIRDATYVLDAILDNETELAIVEHTTDTAGYTDIVFALFDLLGMQFAPRIRDLGDQQLYRWSRTQQVEHLRPRIKGTINQDLILRHWDAMLRLAGSLKLGWVSASLFISKLQAYPRQNILTRALQEYGKLAKTLFILRYLESEEYRRRINAQLNKGEALHALRDFLFVADKGVIRRKQEEAQTHQAMCLNLLTNAVVVWNTVYMQAVIDQLRAEGQPIHDDDVVHLSPARFEHINPYGKYHFALDEERQGLRPLRAA